MRKFLPIILIAAGSFLEVYYYAFRFTSDGVPMWLSVIIGGALTALLSAATLKRENTAAIIIIIILGSYSIFCTSAGQAFSLNIILSEEQVSNIQQLNIQDELDELLLQRGRLNNEYDKIQDQIDSTITTLENRYEWKNTLARAESRQDEIKKELSSISGRVETLRSQQTFRKDTQKVIKNIYIFYSDLFGFNRELLQFFLQTMLSAFIALMAPFGIIMISGKEEEVRQSINWNTYVKKWIKVNWVSVRAQRNNPMIVMSEHFFRSAPRFSKEKYAAIKTAAIETGCIDSSGMIKCKDESKAIKIIKGRLSHGHGKTTVFKNSNGGAVRGSGGARISEKSIRRKNRAAERSDS